MASERTLEDRFSAIATLDRYAAALDSKDWRALEELFTEDFEWTWPDGRTTVGRDAAISAISSVVDQAGPVHSIFGSYRVDIDGDTADVKVHRRTYFASAEPSDRFMESLGDYEVQLRRAGDGWRIARFKESVFIRRGSSDVFKR